MSRVGLSGLSGLSGAWCFAVLDETLPKFSLAAHPQTAATGSWRPSTLDCPFYDWDRVPSWWQKS